MGVPTARQKPGFGGFFYRYSGSAGTSCLRQLLFPFGNANRPVRDAHMGRKHWIEAIQACHRYADMGILSWFFAISNSENITCVEIILPCRRENQSCEHIQLSVCWYSVSFVRSPFSYAYSSPAFFRPSSFLPDCPSLFRL